MKGDIYEAGHRVPFIVKWPGQVQPGSSSLHPNSLANFYATVADLLCTPSKALDSYSLFDEWVQKENKMELKPIVHHSSAGHFAIRCGNWKMIEKKRLGGLPADKVTDTPGEMSERLFNLKDDPSEMSNVSHKFPKNWRN